MQCTIWVSAQVLLRLCATCQTLCSGSISLGVLMHGFCLARIRFGLDVIWFWWVGPEYWHRPVADPHPWRTPTSTTIAFVVQGIHCQKCCPGRWLPLRQTYAPHYATVPHSQCHQTGDRGEQVEWLCFDEVLHSLQGLDAKCQRPHFLTGHGWDHTFRQGVLVLHNECWRESLLVSTHCTQSYLKSPNANSIGCGMQIMTGNVPDCQSLVACNVASMLHPDCKKPPMIIQMWFATSFQNQVQPRHVFWKAL